LTPEFLRVFRGVYDYPKEHPVLGPLSPSVDAVAPAWMHPIFRRLAEDAEKDR